MTSKIQSSLWRAGFALSLGIVFGRAAGFLREASLAAVFGAGESADVAVLMLTVPDFLVNILVGGALSVALIPELKGLDEESASGLFFQASLFTGGTFLVLTLLLQIFRSELIHVLVPGFPASSVEHAASSVGLALWVIPLTTLAGVTSAYLQAHERFAIPAFGTFFFNGIVASGLLYYRQTPTHFRLALFIIAGASVRWASQLGDMQRLPVGRLLGHRNLISRSLLVRYFQALLAGGVILLFPVIARGVASFQHAGAVATLNYANKLVELPLGASITVLSIVLFPRLSTAFVANPDSGEFTLLLRKGVPVVWIVSTGMMLTLIWFHRSLALAAFGWGRMSTDVVTEIGILAAIGLTSLPAQGLSSMVIAAFNARRDTVAPLLVNATGLLFFLAGCWYLSRVVGLRGIMLAMSLSMWAMTLAQSILFQRRHGIPISSFFNGTHILKSSAAEICFFVPIALLSIVLPSRVWIGAVLAVAGCIASIIAGLFFSEWRTPMLGFLRVRRINV